VFCVRSLLQRVVEGSEEVVAARAVGDRHAAARRVRDDLVRLCTANHLLDRNTRPRCAVAIREFTRRYGRVGGLGPRWPTLARWAVHSYGPTGKDEDAPVPLPPGGLAAACRTVEVLRQRTAARLQQHLLLAGAAAPSLRWRG
jgi:hypothetical protein